MMAERTTSPFAGLDKALLRPTSSRSNSSADPEPEPVAPSKPRRVRPNGARPPASKLETTNASAHASTIASYPDGIVETIRRIVKVAGKEVSFVRLSPEEKGELAEIVYTYKRQGRKTSENEINRIAVNFIVEDYKANGAQSILARVIDALLA